MFDLILKAFVSYIEKNPAVLERLIEAAVEAITLHLKASSALASINK